LPSRLIDDGTQISPHVRLVLRKASVVACCNHCHSFRMILETSVACGGQPTYKECGIEPIDIRFEPNYNYETVSETSSYCYSAFGKKYSFQIAPTIGDTQKFYAHLLTFHKIYNKKLIY